MGRLVDVEFECSHCGHRFMAQVPHEVWSQPCPLCGSSSRRLIQVHWVFSVTQRDENIAALKAFNEQEPDEHVIRAVHRYNYGEEPTKKEVEEIRKHRLNIW